MIDYALTVDVWYEITDLDSDAFVWLQADSADPCVVAFDVAEPPATSEIGILLQEGINAIHIPPGKSAWLKLLSGTMTVTFSQFDGIVMDTDKCGYGYEASTPGDTAFVSDVDVQAGQDDATVRDETNPYTFIGYLTTGDAGIAASVTVDSAVLSLVLSGFLADETIRVYASASTTSDFASLVDFAAIEALTVTTAYTDCVVGWAGRERIDVAAILQELVDTMGWATTKRSWQRS